MSIPRSFSSTEILLHKMFLLAWKAFRALSLAPPRMTAGTLSKDTGDTGEPSTCMTASPSWICTPPFPPIRKGVLSTQFAIACVFLALRKRFFFPKLLFEDGERLDQPFPVMDP